MCMCVCLKVSEGVAQRGDIGRLASPHRHQNEGQEALNNFSKVHLTCGLTGETEFFLEIAGINELVQQQQFQESLQDARMLFVHGLLKKNDNRAFPLQKNTSTAYRNNVVHSMKNQMGAL